MSTCLGRTAILTLAFFLLMGGTLAATEEARGKPPADREGSEMYWWDWDPTPQGMITVSYVSAHDSAIPDAQGIRIGYGSWGIGDEAFGLGGYWLEVLKKGRHRISALGISAVPVEFFYRRLAGGPLVEIGVSRRTAGDRSVLAGLIGLGGEASIRLFRRWDLVVNAKADYRTTSDVAYKGGIGIRFHSEKLYPDDY